jgi:hypothetical protein
MSRLVGICYFLGTWLVNYLCSVHDNDLQLSLGLLLLSINRFCTFVFAVIYCSFLCEALLFVGF